ncbi:exported hypothetical protein [Candidatus Sulfopaludibacter sp. SbA4]|nr:exported hypothetical protein [Candidatus Sulfopaludibacter sp. SbA4]
MKVIALSAALAMRLAAQPAVNAVALADDALKAARAAIGAKLSTLQSLSLWGAYHRGPQASEMTLTIDLSGRYLKEQSTLSSGGQVERVGGDGAVGGGMPGDEGGPAFSLGLTEGYDGDDYWTRNGAGSGKSTFVANFVRYVVALTLSAPAGYPVAFTYGSRLDSPQGPLDALEGKGPGDFLIHLYLDAKTHLPVTMVYHQGGQEIQLWLKDYKAEEGIRFPHTMAWLSDGYLVEEFQIQHFKVNPKLRSDKFRRR